MKSTRDDAVEVQFTVHQDDGWPPTPVEPIWCVPVRGEADVYKVTNVPIHVLGLARGDDICAERGQGGPLEFVRHVRHGGHSTLRVIVAELDDVDAVAETVRSFGAVVQDTYIPQLLCVDVPADVDMTPIMAWLTDADASERIDWEEGVVAPHHMVAH